MSMRTICIALSLAALVAVPAWAAPIGQSRETLGAAIERSPLVVVATVQGVDRSAPAQETAELLVEAVLRAQPGAGAGLAVEDGATILAISDARLDHAARLAPDTRVLAFLRPAAEDGAFVPMVTVRLDGEDGADLEQAARDIAAALGEANPKLRARALAAIYGRQAAGGRAGVAADAAVELVRSDALREALSADEARALVARLKDEPNRSEAKLALVELAGTLGAPGTADALVASLERSGSDGICGLACRALAHVADPEAGPRVRAALTGASTKEARLSLLAAVRSISLGDAAEEVGGLLGADDPDIRLEAIKTLDAIGGGGKAREAIDQAARLDGDAKVRDAASALLRKLSED